MKKLGFILIGLAWVIIVSGIPRRSGSVNLTRLGLPGRLSILRNSAVCSSRN